MKTLLSKILLAIIVALSSFSAKGQDSLKIDEWDLQDLINVKVVSAGKKEQGVEQAPANVIVITSEQIENRGYLTLQEVLKDLPGFDFAVGQPSGEYPTHFIFRGIGDVGQTKFAMLVDGVLQNDISNGWFRHVGYNFSLSQIDRIELVSGPGSSLYGMNALAGYINIITKETYKSAPYNTKATSTTFTSVNNTISQDLNGFHKFNNGITFELSGRYFQTNGDQGLNRYDPGNYFTNNFEPDSIKTMDGNLIENETVDGKTKALADGFNNEIQDYYLRGKINYKDFTLTIAGWEKSEGLGSYVVGYEYFTNTDGVDYKVNHKGRSYEMKYSFSPSPMVKSNSKTYINHQTIKPQTGFSYTYQFQDVNNGVDPVEENYKKTYESEGFVFGVEQQLDFSTSKNNNIIIGLQFEQKIREFFNINYITGIDESSLSTINQTINLRPVFFSFNGAAFIQDEYSISKKLRLTGGLRLDFDEFYGRIINPRLALVRHSPKGFNYKLLFGQGYKPPTIFELYDEWRGNHELVPEIVRTAEIEAGYKARKFNVTGNLFYNNLTNSIKIADNMDTTATPIGPDGQYATFYQNQGEMDIIGFSLRGHFALSEHFILSGNYQFLEDLNSGALDNVSKHKANIAINWFIKEKVNINLRGNWVSKIKAPATNLYFHEKNSSTISEVGYDYVTEDNPDGYLEGHVLLNLTVTGKNILVFKGFQIEPVLKINNLLNNQYAFIGRQSGSGTRPVDEIQSSVLNPNGFIPAYHPQAGIQIFGALRVKFN